MATGGDLSRSLLGGHEAFFDFPCTLCEEQEKHREATRYCEECLVFLCDVCLRSIHNRIPLNTRHKLLEQEKFTTVSQSVVKSFPTKRCSQHPGELLNIYCGNHDEICCSVCKALEHRNQGMEIAGLNPVRGNNFRRSSHSSMLHKYCTCGKTQHLPDAAKGVQTSKEYQNIKKETKDFLADVSNLHAKQTAAISRIALEKQHVKETITDFRKKMNTIFDNLEKKSLQVLDTKEATIVNALDSDRSFLNGAKKEAGEMLQMFETFKGDNECELFSLVKAGQHLIHESTKRMKDMSSTAPRSIIFNIDESIENNLRSVVTLGSFVDMAITTSTQSVSSMIDSNIQQVASDQAFVSSANTTNTSLSHVSQYSSHVEAQETSVDFVEYDIKLFGKFDVKEKSDTQVCYITDICQLTDGSMLITDNNNKKLKRLDQSYRPVDSLHLPGNPVCVCAVGPGEAAVSLCNDKKVQFVSVGRKLSLTKSFSTRSYCRGMVYTGDKLYVCCGYYRDSSSGSIEVYNNTGQLQYSLPRGSQRLSAVPVYITVSDDGQYLFVTSYKSDNISMLDLDGNVVNTFSSKEVKTPTGICTVDRGHVFVCGVNSYTIAQLSPKYQRIEVILTDKDGVLEPYGVYYAKKTSRLLVSCHESNKLLVYTCSLTKS